MHQSLAILNVHSDVMNSGQSPRPRSLAKFPVCEIKQQQPHTVWNIVHPLLQSAQARSAPNKSGRPQAATTARMPKPDPRLHPLLQSAQARSAPNESGRPQQPRSRNNRENAQARSAQKPRRRYGLSKSQSNHQHSPEQPKSSVTIQ
jgi:hypothetical protein